jgi:hypothetical protein
MKFKDLEIGQLFDWIDDVRRDDHFYQLCWKVGKRTYADEHGTRHTVGSINANVFHVPFVLGKTKADNVAKGV